MSRFHALLFHDLEQDASCELAGQNDFTVFFVDLKPFDASSGDLVLSVICFAAVVLAFYRELTGGEEGPKQN